jgi:two-component system NarL family sensor kinase
MPSRLIEHRSACHIGLASHRARVEAAGGTLRIVDASDGAHITVTVPLGT